MKNKKVRTMDFSKKKIDIKSIREKSKSYILPICARLLPEGKTVGGEYVARNPKRSDRTFGSFKINLITGQWCDFAVSDARGGDIISLVAYLQDIRQIEAAKLVAQMIGGSYE